MEHHELRLQHNGAAAAHVENVYPIEKVKMDGEIETDDACERITPA